MDSFNQIKPLKTKILTAKLENSKVHISETIKQSDFVNSLPIKSVQKRVKFAVPSLKFAMPNLDSNIVNSSVYKENGFVFKFDYICILSKLINEGH